MPKKAGDFKMKISPALIAALDHFAGRQYDWSQPTLFKYTNAASQHESLWPIERCCALAHEICSDEDLYRLKFEALCNGLKH